MKKLILSLMVALGVSAYCQQSHIIVIEDIVVTDSIPTSAAEKIDGETKPQPNIIITSDDVDGTGHASAYHSHSFKVECNGYTLSDPSWELILTLADGSPETITLTDDNLSCNTCPISNINRYEITSDGNIEGILKFTGYADGEKISSAPFSILFALRPVIDYATIERIEDNSPYASYNAYYSVKYHGASKIKVSVEEEYGSKLKTQFIHEPYIAHGVAEYIAARYCAWIDFTASNDYGKTVYTIELGPYGELISSNPEGGSSGINDIEIDDADSNGSRIPERVQLIKLDGSLVYDGPSTDFTDGTILPGIYIRKDIFSDGSMKTDKIILR